MSRDRRAWQAAAPARRGKWGAELVGEVIGSAVRAPAAVEKTRRFVSTTLAGATVATIGAVIDWNRAAR